MANSFLDCLDDETLLRLETSSPATRRTVEYLVSGNAAARLLGLAAVQELAEGGQAEAILPFAFALGTSARYPHASGLLTRLGSLLDAVDDPPRSSATGGPGRRIWKVFDGQVRRLLRTAWTSKDPESTRAIARMLLHFARADAELVPLFLALLSGAQDHEQRAPLLYGLAYAQGVAEAALHPRVEAALRMDAIHLERAAVALALSTEGVPVPEERRPLLVAALERLAGAQSATVAWSDPRSWGRRYDPGAVTRALERLTRGPGGRSESEV